MKFLICRMKIATEIYAYTETLKSLQCLKPFDDGDVMASKSIVTDFDIRLC
jgi:hypothetical protein